MAQVSSYYTASQAVIYEPWYGVPYSSGDPRSFSYDDQNGIANAQNLPGSTITVSASGVTILGGAWYDLFVSTSDSADWLYNGAPNKEWMGPAAGISNEHMQGTPKTSYSAGSGTITITMTKYRENAYTGGTPPPPITGWDLFEVSSTVPTGSPGDTSVLIEPAQYFTLTFTVNPLYYQKIK